MASRETHNACRILALDNIRAEAERVAYATGPAEFRAWAVTKMEPVDLEQFCPPDDVDWTEVHTRFVTGYYAAGTDAPE
jgi:hypothetical protein